GMSERSPGRPGNSFFKMGTANPNDTPTRGREWMNGYTYIFHNTLANPDGLGPHGLGHQSRPMRKVISRNNVLFVGDRASHSIGVSQHHADVDFDFDLYNETVPEGSERSGFRGEPTFALGRFDRETLTASYGLAATSLGVDGGEVLPNFSDVFEGAGPDVGAHEGADAVTYGPGASEVPPALCENGLCGAACDRPCEPDGACAGSPTQVANAALNVDGRAEEARPTAPIALAAGEAEANVILAWTDTALFVRAEVADSDLRAHVERGATGSVWRDDAVEIFLDANQSRDGFSDDDLQLVVSARGALFTSRRVDVDVATTARGTFNDDVDDEGYVIEAAIPWDSLGVSPAEGLTMGIDLALDDRARPDDGSERGGTNATSDWADLASYRDPPQWCALTLGAPPNDTGPTTDAGLEDAGVPEVGADATEPSPTGSGGCSTGPASDLGLWSILGLAFVRRRRVSFP
ncbi:MAG: sugar-binding protein, partial [Myxococcota bacterium]